MAERFSLRTHPRRDLVIGATVFLIASIGGTYYRYVSSKTGTHGAFYQELHEPAVMLACGHGFSVSIAPQPQLQQFLRFAVDGFSCDQLPRDIRTKPAVELTARQSRYLMSAVALTWRLTGISWTGLAPLFGILFGATVATGYLLFRLGMGWPLAVALATAFATLPLHMRNLHNLRDYAIAPFILGAFVLIGRIVLRRPSARRLLAVSAACGAVVGIGYGFRPDVTIVAPLFVLALFGFVPGPLCAHLRWKCAGALTALAVFIVLSWPILGPNLRVGSCVNQTIVEGLGNQFTGNLGLTPAPYDWGRNYDDLLAYEATTAFAQRRSPGSPPVEYCSNEDDKAGLSYLLAVARTFPADMLTRVYASVLGIAGLPFMPSSYVTWRLTGAYVNTGLLWIVAAILLAAWKELRAGIFLSCFLLYVGGYPALQFDPRHHFYLAFIAFWAQGYVLHHGWAFMRHRQDAGASWTRTVRVASFAVISTAAIWGSLLLLQQYQQRQVTALLQAYLDFPIRPLAPEELPLDNPAVRGTGQPTMLVATAVHMWECDDPVTVTFRYDGPDPDVRRFTGSVDIDSALSIRKATMVFGPVYRGFQGVSVEPAACGEAVSRVEAEAQPLWVTAVLSPGWRDLPLYQRLEHPLLLHKPMPDFKNAWTPHRQ